MDKFHNKGSDKLDKIVDDIKKKVGESRQYIDDKIEGVCSVATQIDSECKDLCEGLKNDISKLKTDFDLINKKSDTFMGIVSKNCEDIQSFEKEKISIHSVNRSFANVQKEILSLIKESDNDTCSLISDIYKQVENFKNSLEEMNLELSELLTIINLHSSNITNLQENNSLAISLCGKNEKQTAKLDCLCKSVEKSSIYLSEIFVVFSKQIEKRLGNLEERYKFLSDTVREIKESSKDSPSIKEFTQLKNIVDLMPSGTRREDIASDWKHQMELKIARVEKKINGD